MENKQILEKIIYEIEQAKNDESHPLRLFLDKKVIPALPAINAFNEELSKASNDAKKIKNLIETGSLPDFYKLEPINGLTLLCILDDENINFSAELKNQIREAKSKGARKAAQAKLKNDPKQRRKRDVFRRWEDWKNNPKLHRSTSAFAREMLEEFEELGSQKVIEGWCRQWKKEWEKSSQHAE